MKFRKYNKLIQSYDAKSIKWWTSRYPELVNESYCLSEKADGANMAINIDGSGGVSYQKRNAVDSTDDGCLATESSFFGWQSVMDSRSSDIQNLVNFVINRDDISDLRLYGELIGSCINRRISYGDENDFLPFEIHLNGQPISYEESRCIMLQAGIGDWWVPVLFISSSLKEALEFNIEGVKTLINPSHTTGEKQIEGVVIAPFSKVYAHNRGGDGDEISVFRLKYKSEAFHDISAAKHEHKKNKSIEEFEGSGEWCVQKSLWAMYFTENRLIDLTSKLGPLTELKQMGEYLKALISDAKEDYLINEGVAFRNLNLKEQKDIMSGSAQLAVVLIKEYLGIPRKRS
jgi:hypothetical protein